MTLPTLSEVYARWHNPNHGFEKNPDINFERGFNDKGMLDHCIFLFVLKTSGIHRPEFYNILYHDINRLATYRTGVYYANNYDRYEKNKKVEPCRVENYFGIVLSAIMGTFFGVCRGVSIRVKNNFGTFSTKDTPFKLPFSFPTLCMFLYCSGDVLLAKFFYPFFLISAFFYSFFKDKFIEKKLIYLIFLYNLKYKHEINFMYNYYIRKFKKDYGDNFLNYFLLNYYENKNHPSILYSENITLQEVTAWKRK